jgi:hypothetical protein
MANIGRSRRQGFQPLGQQWNSDPSGLARHRIDGAPGLFRSQGPDRNVSASRGRNEPDANAVLILHGNGRPTGDSLRFIFDAVYLPSSGSLLQPTAAHLV